MTKTIWKFEMPIGDKLTIIMPTDAKVLTVQMQRDIPCLWAIVDLNAGNELRTFAWRGTGHLTNGVEDAEYIGTVQMRELVFHLFETNKKP